MSNSPVNIYREELEKFITALRKPIVITRDNAEDKVLELATQIRLDFADALEEKIEEIELEVCRAEIRRERLLRGENNDR